MLTAKWKNLIGILFLVLGMAYAISPFFKEVTIERHGDARYLYINGVCWFSGKCPYHTDIYKEVWKERMKNESSRKELGGKDGGAAAPLYPPSLAIYTMPSIFFAWDTAKYYYDIMSVICLLTMMFFLTRLIKDLPEVRANVGKIGLVMGLGCLISAIPATIFVGQLSLVALAGALGAFYFSEHKRFFIAGLFVVLASIKPHLTLPFVIYLFIQQKNWRLFGWSSLLVGTTFLGILIMGGDLNPLPEIMVNYQTYTHYKADVSSKLPGLTYLTTSLGIDRAILILLGLVIMTLLAFWFRKINTMSHHQNLSKTEENRMKEQGILEMAFIFTLTALFMPLHGYDYSIFFPVVVLLVVVRWNLAMWLIPGIASVARPGNLVAILHVMGIPVSGILLASLGVIYLTLTIAIIIWKLRKEALEISPQVIFT
ncbi:hypothetical protein THII_0731 [Thioploca ingrica]|uniref:Uncharacterized protein n=1 Tax=Thioploca ingrica TaxID=40754 RepID=A0A090ABL7_9GAMM|nr:hypothetical protein THII_0731 [Thioploca ingrica]